MSSQESSASRRRDVSGRPGRVSEHLRTRGSMWHVSNMCTLVVTLHVCVCQQHCKVAKVCKEGEACLVTLVYIQVACMYTQYMHMQNRRTQCPACLVWRNEDGFSTKVLFVQHKFYSFSAIAAKRSITKWMEHSVQLSAACH